jgi:hypothetical protein
MLEVAMTEPLLLTFKETVNKPIQSKSVNRLHKLSKQEKAIIDWLTADHGALVELSYRTSKGIAYALLEQKHNRYPSEYNEYDFDEEYAKTDFAALTEAEKQFVSRKLQYARGIGKLTHAYSRLPHFLAQIKKSDLFSLTTDDFCDFDKYEGYIGTKKELLREANSIRASVCRSLKRLMKRGLIISLTITEVYTIFGKRNSHFEKTFYFISREQGQKIVDADKFLHMKGTWSVKEDDSP